MGILGKIFRKQDPLSVNIAPEKAGKTTQINPAGSEWEKYCTKLGKEVTILHEKELFGCRTSLPTKDCCMDGECIYHNTNFFALQLFVQLRNGVMPDYSSWSLEHYESFITKNLPGKKNYCKSISSSTPSDEDPSIYGTLLKPLRDTIRSQNGSTRCIVCNAKVIIDFKKIEQQIRNCQQIAKQATGVPIFSPDPNNPKICLPCKGVICNTCSKKAMASKRTDRAEITRLLSQYQPAMRMLSKEDLEQTIEACLAPNEPSTILCPKCRNDLLRDIDHITD